MTIRQPRVLADIMDTIARLKDSKGSPADTIIENLTSHRKAPLRNASLRIKKALRSGLRHGLLKETDGKYKLGLGTKEFATLRYFRKNEERLPRMSLPVKEVRRRGGRRRRSKGRRRKGRRRGRRRSGSVRMEVEAGDSSEPMDRSRRRRSRSRKRRGRSRRRRGRRRTSGLEDRTFVVSSESAELSSKSSQEKPTEVKKEEKNVAVKKEDTVKDPEKAETVSPTSETPRNPENRCIYEQDRHHEVPPPFGYPPYPGPGYYGEHYYR